MWDIKVLPPEGSVRGIVASNLDGAARRNPAPAAELNTAPGRPCRVSPAPPYFEKSTFTPWAIFYYLCIIDHAWEPKPPQ